MARRKEYDREDVLAKAATVFWTKGYKATSVADIVQATGLNTASMYKEFGDKDGLFEETLDYYRQHVLSSRIKILTNQPDVKGIEAFLDSVVKGAASRTYKGCLMMNHLAQRHIISTRAAEQINEVCSTMEGLLENAFRNAQAKGEIASSKDPAALASFVMCCVHGLVLYGRHPNTEGEIRNIHDVVLSALNA